MDRPIEREWSEPSSLVDYRRRARTRNALTNFTMVGAAAGFVAMLVLILVGVSTFLRWILTTLVPHLPAFSWAAPHHHGTIHALVAALFG